MTQVGNVRGLRPLTARSVVLSTLLGTHPPRLPVRYLVRVGDLFGIADGTLRVALSRMVADGDLEAEDGEYRLTGRLLDRQARQDESLSPHTRPWRGRWEIAVVTAAERTRADRDALRTVMATLRFAELREGVWTRPANLVYVRPAVATGQCLFAEAEVGADALALAASLWDLDGWAGTAKALLGAMDGVTEPPERFTVGAAMLHHLLADPVLPDALLPPDWPGSALRHAYAEFGRHFRLLLTEQPA